MSEQSYRTILRSSSIIGGSKVVNVAIGLVKMKAVAVLLGPSGVGLAGLYLNLIQTAASVSSMGLGTVGTRQIAAANAVGGEEAVGRTRRALLWGTIWLSLLGAAIFWLSSGWIARFILGDESRSAEVAWLSLGVALTVAAGSQGALLTGLRRVGDLARINIVSGLLGAVFGVLAVWICGSYGVLVMVLVGPVVTFVAGHVFVLRLGPAAGQKATRAEMFGQWRAMAGLGVAFMMSGVVTTLGHLAVRALVQRELGSDALGNFQAAWSIGMTYLGFVLAAMGTDFYPRLTAVMGDHPAAVRLVNQQVEVALLLCAPVLLAMLGFAPWVIQLLYSGEFGPAVDILRWHLVADVLKVMSWPLGFILLAAGAGKTFVTVEFVGIAVLVSGVILGLPVIGITAAGVSFFGLYATYLPLVYWLGLRRIGFNWARASWLQAFVVFCAAASIAVVGHWFPLGGAILGGASSVVALLWSIARLSAITEAQGRLKSVAVLGKRLRVWLAERLR